MRSGARMLPTRITGDTPSHSLQLHGILPAKFSLHETHTKVGVSKGEAPGPSSAVGKRSLRTLPAGAWPWSGHPNDPYAAVGLQHLRCVPVPAHSCPIQSHQYLHRKIPYFRKVEKHLQYAPQNRGEPTSGGCPRLAPPASRCPPGAGTGHPVSRSSCWVVLPTGSWGMGGG